MIIRYYDSALTFESSETIDYYTDYETLKADGGAKFISFPNQRFARALRQTQMLYIHGIGGGGVWQNGNFSAGGLSFIDPWIFTQQTTSDTHSQIFNPGGGVGDYYALITLNNSADDDAPADLSRFTQVGSFISSAGASIQLQVNIRVRFTPVEEIPVEPDPYPKRYWYLRVGSNYYNESTGTWVGSLVWNQFGLGDDLELLTQLNYNFVNYSFTTPALIDSGVVEMAVTGTTGDQNFVAGMGYDNADINLIVDGVLDSNYATNYRANVPTRASLAESVGTILNADGPTGGNQSRLTRDEAGTISTTSWGGLPLQDVIVRRWLGVLRANRRMVEGEMIGIDPLGRINRGLFYRGRFFAPVFAEWLARSRTWRVRLHEYATDEEGVTNTLSREDNRRNKSGDIYEAPIIIS